MNNAYAIDGYVYDDSDVYVRNDPFSCALVLFLSSHWRACCGCSSCPDGACCPNFDYDGSTEYFTPYADQGTQLGSGGVPPTQPSGTASQLHIGRYFRCCAAGDECDYNAATGRKQCRAPIPRTREVLDAPVPCASASCPPYERSQSVTAPAAAVP